MGKWADGWETGDGKERRLRTYSGQERRLESGCQAPCTSVSFSLDFFLISLTSFNVCCPTVI